MTARMEWHGNALRLAGRAAILLTLASGVAWAQAHESQAGKAPPKSRTLTGEIVDMGCYLGREAKGADHRSCALKCVAGGMPMGLLTADGSLYLLTMNHENADAYNKAKEMAGLAVEVTGPVFERDGIKALDLVSIANTKPGTPGSKGGANTAMYVCPMHPDVQSNQAGSCPKCGMSLERKASN